MKQRNETDRFTDLGIDADEGVGLGVKLLLQRDDDGLEVLDGLVFNVVSDLQVNTRVRASDRAGCSDNNR